MNDTLVLCYHAVSADWPVEMAVGPEALGRQVGHLLEAGYVATTFTDAVTLPPAGRRVAVTFDDGFRSVVDLGFPVLERLGVPATLFVPTAKVGVAGPMLWPGIDRWAETPHRDELLGASWRQIEDLAEAGWEIGSHSCTHPRLTELDDEALNRELGESRRQLEHRLGRPCRSLAYPYGDVDDRVSAFARRAGYEAGAALPDRPRWRAREMTWPRIMISRLESDADYRRHVSKWFRSLRASPLWGPIESAVPVVRRLQRRSG